MKELKISNQRLAKVIRKTEGFKHFINTYKERMKDFCNGHYTAVRIEHGFSISLTFTYHHPDFEESVRTETSCIYIGCDDTIITNYDFIEKPESILSKLAARHILDSLQLRDVECYHVIDKVEATCDAFRWHIDDLYAWTGEMVGMYHIEQECGEGWFIMPKEPNKNLKNYIDIR